jgi:hypothetical protein
MPFAPERCPRCGGSMGCSSGSYFDMQMICCTCKTEERQFPNYTLALETESAQVLAGNLNYPGIGLSSADYEVMAQLIAARKDADGATTPGV